ncbi:alpha/beta fold hydrolase [Streptomyces spiramenti]|uniref:alpha/beta fold hydrolase n=1 Tax=Streptomyces spiramenti TaxID=2720606 RepID=UPI0030843B30
MTPRPRARRPPGRRTPRWSAPRLPAHRPGARPGRRRPWSSHRPPATGAKASYHWRSASHLADAAFRAVAAGHRGIGRSGPAGGGRALRSLPVRCHQWGTPDLVAVLGRARRTAPEDRLVVVGHSLGGFATCLAPRVPEVSRLLLVGAQHAHWADPRRHGRLDTLRRRHVAMPALTPACGYFPGRRLGRTEELPRGVAFDRARGRADFARTMGRADRDALRRAATLDLDVLAVAAGDDLFATNGATERTPARPTSARVQRWVVEPDDHGLGPIGHPGLFHDCFRPAFRPRSAELPAAGPAQRSRRVRTTVHPGLSPPCSGARVDRTPDGYQEDRPDPCACCSSDTARPPRTYGACWTPPRPVRR